MKEFEGGRIRVKTGDITREEADVIVNAANSSLMGGGGVDGAIHRAGGPSILEECRKIRRTKYWDGLPPGEAVATTAGNLPAKWVVHTVGPVWKGGGAGEEATLARCYRNALEEARRLGAETVAFPAVSTGVYGFPREKAAPVAYRTVKEFLGKERGMRVTFVFFSEDDMRVFLSACGEKEDRGTS